MENESILIAMCVVLGAGCFILPLLALFSGERKVKNLSKESQVTIDELKATMDSIDESRVEAVNEVISLSKQIESQRIMFEARVKRLNDELHKYKPARGKGGKFVSKN